MHSEPVISITNVSKAYSHHSLPNGYKSIFKDFSIHLRYGEITGIIGPNGSGKTTLLKLICGLITPDDGSISVLGRNLRHSQSSIMKEIGIVLEGSRNLYWRLSAWQNLLYFGGLKGIFGRDAKMAAEKLLKGLQLWDVRHQLVQSFSRGMQQKLAIACAFISDPTIILLDEPSLGLDAESQDIIENWIQDAANEYNKTIVITSHHTDMIERLCHRVLVLKSGVIIQDFSTFDIMEKRNTSYQIKLQGTLNSWPLSLSQDWILKPHLAKEGIWLLTGKIHAQPRLQSVLNHILQSGCAILSVTTLPFTPDN